MIETFLYRETPIRVVKDDVGSHIVIADIAKALGAAREAAKHVQIAEAPWNGIALSYEGNLIYEDPAERGLWATQRQIASLYNCTVKNVSLHLQRVSEDVTEHMRIHFIVRQEAGRDVGRQVVLYDFHKISAIGDRVASAKAMAFRIWRADWLQARLVGLDRQTKEISRLERDLKAARDSLARETSSLHEQATEAIISAKSANNCRDALLEEITKLRGENDALRIKNNKDRQDHLNELLQTNYRKTDCRQG